MHAIRNSTSIDPADGRGQNSTIDPPSEERKQQLATTGGVLDNINPNLTIADDKIVNIDPPTSSTANVAGPVIGGNETGVSILQNVLKGIEAGRIKTSTIANHFIDGIDFTSNNVLIGVLKNIKIPSVATDKAIRILEKGKVDPEKVAEVIRAGMAQGKMTSKDLFKAMLEGLTNGTIKISEVGRVIANGAKKKFLENAVDQFVSSAQTVGGVTNSAGKLFGKAVSATGSTASDLASKFGNLLANPSFNAWDIISGSARSLDRGAGSVLHALGIDSAEDLKRLFRINAAPVQRAPQIASNFATSVNPPRVNPPSVNTPSVNPPSVNPPRVNTPSVNTPSVNPRPARNSFTSGRGGGQSDSRGLGPISGPGGGNSDSRGLGPISGPQDPPANGAPQINNDAPQINSGPQDPGPLANGRLGARSNRGAPADGERRSARTPQIRQLHNAEEPIISGNRQRDRRLRRLRRVRARDPMVFSRTAFDHPPAYIAPAEVNQQEPHFAGNAGIGTSPFLELALNTAVAALTDQSSVPALKRGAEAFANSGFTSSGGLLQALALTTTILENFMPVDSPPPQLNPVKKAKRAKQRARNQISGRVEDDEKERREKAKGKRRRLK